MYFICKAWNLLSLGAILLQNVIGADQLMHSSSETFAASMKSAQIQSERTHKLLQSEFWLNLFVSVFVVYTVLCASDANRWIYC